MTFGCRGNVTLLQCDGTQSPLKSNEKHSLFRFFMRDIGLLCTSCMENVWLSILSGDLEINMGSVLENVMAQ